ncbi:hypothetical protein SDC9_172205 [bioreactor metagenome]|uniref:Uncharacterized protein n=1 Tax=bioreactor metagenome TaxID=1076179 RepID=A0A645GM72_9ZZZZ
MPVAYRNPDAGGADGHGVISQDLAGFVDHLLLFLGVAGVEKYVDLRQNVARDRVRELFGCVAL